MKKILSVIFVSLFFSGNVYADNISDFQIEGMSLGDSALKYYSKASIDSNTQNWYKGKKYKTSAIGNIQISFKSKDEKYILEGIDLVETMDISKCSNQIESEVQAIKELFSNNVKLEGPIRSKHWADKTKKSWFDTYEFKFPTKDFIFVECYNWSENVSWQDHMRFKNTSKRFIRFLNNQ